MFNSLTQDASFLTLVLSISGCLFVISIVRIILLSKSNSRMLKELAQMRKQAALQQVEITALHHDSKSWRAKIQRQFDALRTDYVHRLRQSEKSNAKAQEQLDISQSQALVEALARIQELQASNKSRPALVPTLLSKIPEATPPNEEMTAVMTPSVGEGLPSLPAMETLRIQSLETSLAKARVEIASSIQRNSELQRALLLARRRTTNSRKTGGRVTRNS